MNQLIDNITSSFNFDDLQSGKKAIATLTQYFAALPPSTSKTDTRRLGSQSVLISKLRNLRIDKSSGVEYEGEPFTKEQKEFNQLSLREQLTFQKKAQLLGTLDWVHNLQLLPPTIDDVRMSQANDNALKQQRKKADEAKLNKENDTVDVTVLQDKLFHAFANPEASFNAVVAALLLATGRRKLKSCSLDSSI